MQPKNQACLLFLLGVNWEGTKEKKKQKKHEYRKEKGDGCGGLKWFQQWKPTEKNNGKPTPMRS